MKNAAPNKAGSIGDTSGAIIASADSRQFSRGWSGQPNPKDRPGQRPIAKPPVVIDNEPIATVDDPWLVDLKAKITSEHVAVIGSFKCGFEHAVKCGELLLEAKEVAGHGNWAKWLSGMPFAETTARGYMRMAEAWPSMPDENRQRVADLPWREALKLIAKPKDAEEPTAPGPAPAPNRPATENKDALILRLQDENAALRAIAERDEVVTAETEADDLSEEKSETKKSKKANSRPARWAAAIASATDAIQELIDIQGEYRDWAENLPENLQDGATAEKLQAIADIDFDGIIDTLSEAESADLPLGFGRD
jgi:Protein of unknown function (DUF3102)